MVLAFEIPKWIFSLTHSLFYNILLQPSLPRGPIHVYLNLPGRVDDDVFMLALSLVQQAKQLVKLGGEQVKRGHYAAVRTQAVLLHHVLVLHCVSDVWQTKNK